MHILHIVLYKFPKVLTRSIFLTIKGILSLWILMFLFDSVVIF